MTLKHHPVKAIRQWIWSFKQKWWPTVAGSGMRNGHALPLFLKKILKVTTNFSSFNKIFIKWPGKLDAVGSNLPTRGFLSHVRLSANENKWDSNYASNQHFILEGYSYMHHWLTYFKYIRTSCLGKNISWSLEWVSLIPRYWRNRLNDTSKINKSRIIPGI